MTGPRSRRHAATSPLTRTVIGSLWLATTDSRPSMLRYSTFVRCARCSGSRSNMSSSDAQLPGSAAHSESGLTTAALVCTPSIAPAHQRRLQNFRGRDGSRFVKPVPLPRVTLEPSRVTAGTARRYGFAPAAQGERVGERAYSGYGEVGVV